MFDILQYLPAKRKQTSSGWISFNAPCCTHNGESADKRQRGGIKVHEDSWSYHCFNCNYTASFLMGRTLSFKARRLLQWIGVPQDDIERVNLESLRHRSIEGIAQERRALTERLMNIEFEERDLPDFAEFLTPQKPLWKYVQERCLPENYPYMFQDHEHVTRHGLVVPFTYNNTVVGHTTRYIDGRKPKFIQDAQPGYVFGTDLQQQHWQYAILVEGVFDALCIDGLAVLHNEVNAQQVRVIRNLEKQIIVVPDHDEAGLKLIDSAQENHWSVSVPDWPSEVKDVNDAVCKYGKLTTLVSIFENRVSGNIKIKMARKKLERKIR